MSTVCGHCHREFRGRHVQSMSWHKNKRLFICRRCWSDHYERRNKKERFRGFSAHKILIGFTCFLLVFLPILPVLGFGEVYVRYQWDRMETTSIRDMKEGEVVKLEVWVEGSPSRTYLDGMERKIGDEWEWMWYYGQHFAVRDNNNSLARVNTEDYFEIEYGHHPAPDAPNTEAKVYKGGDHMVIIGKVERGGEMGKVQIIWAGRSEDDLLSLREDSVAVSVGTVVFLSLSYLVMFAYLLVQRSWHRKTLGRLIPGSFNEFRPRRDPDLHWVENKGLLHPWLTLIGGICSLLFIFLFLVPLLQGDVEVLDEMSGRALLGSMSLFAFMILMVTDFAAMLVEMDRNRPRAVACSKNGIHFLYRTPEESYLSGDFLAWKEIRDFGAERAYKRFLKLWRFELKGDRKRDAHLLTKKVREHILENWKQRK